MRILPQGSVLINTVPTRSDGIDLLQSGNVGPKTMSSQYHIHIIDALTAAGACSEVIMQQFSVTKLYRHSRLDVFVKHATAKHGMLQVQ